MSTLTTSPPPTNPPPGRSRTVQALRALGWALIIAGAVVLLYVVYALWLTGIETRRAQQQLGQQWDQQAIARGNGGGSEARSLDEADDPPAPAEGAEPDGGSLVDEAVARLEFERPGSDEAPVSDEPLFVVDGVGYDDLAHGPGHYPDSAAPGDDGNFAVAGHRTTYGAPFHSLDDLQEGDEIRVTDRSGREHVYEFVDQEIVSPDAGWVLGDDPLDGDGSLVTLTTCHPRFSAAQRMVVFGELVS